MRITETIKQGNRITGYIIDNGKNKKQESKEKVVELIKNKQIDNATVQMWQGKPIVRIKDNADKNVNNVGTSLPYQGMSIADSIAGAIKANNSVELSGVELLNILKNTEVGVPLKLKLSETLDWKQVLFVGEEFDNQRKINTFNFFDGSGINGRFSLSDRFILNNHNIKAKFNDNDATEVAFLINYLKKGPFDLNRDNENSQRETIKTERASKINEYKKTEKIVDNKYYSFINKDKLEPGSTVRACDRVCDCTAESYEEAANNMKTQLAKTLLARNGLKFYDTTKVRLNKLQKLPCIKNLVFVGNKEEMCSNVFYTKITVQNGIHKLSETIFIAKR